MQSVRWAPGSRPSSSLALGLTERDMWITDTMRRLESFQPGPSTADARRRVHVVSGRVRYVVDEEGLFRFGDDSWLYDVTHSSHARDDIGNVILAVDHTGQLYRNEAHVCRNVELRPPRGSDFESIDGVLSTKVDGLSWHPVQRQ